MAVSITFALSAARSTRKIHIFGRFCSLDFIRSLSTVPPKPKRPLAGFINFSRAQNVTDESSVTQRAILNAKKWKLLTEEQKEVYKPSSAILEAYNRNLAEWNASLTFEQRIEIQSDLKKRREHLARCRLRKKRREMGMPLKGALSGYLLYVTAAPAPRGSPSNKYIKDMAELWRVMPTKDKQRYQEKADEAKKQYHERMEMWENNMIHAGHFDVIRKASVPDYIDSVTRKPIPPARKPRVSGKSKKRPKAN